MSSTRSVTSFPFSGRPETMRFSFLFSTSASSSTACFSCGGDRSPGLTCVTLAVLVSTICIISSFSFPSSWVVLVSFSFFSSRTPLETISANVLFCAAFAFSREAVLSFVSAKPASTAWILETPSSFILAASSTALSLCSTCSANIQNLHV